MKRYFYEILWVITGLLLGILVGALIELALLNTNLSYSVYYIYIPTMLLGLALGIWVGPVAWRKIYIEGVRGQKYVIKK